MLIAKVFPAIAVAAFSLTAAAAEMDVRTTFSGTAEPGFYYNEGAWVKSEMVPHSMRQTDTQVVIATVPGSGFTKDEGNRYIKRIEVPHTMSVGTGYELPAGSDR